MSGLKYLSAILLIFCIQEIQPLEAGVIHDPSAKTIILSANGGDLSLRINYAQGCLLDQIMVHGTEVAGSGNRVISGFRFGDSLYSSGNTLQKPVVKVGKESVTIDGIRFGTAGFQVEEQWVFAITDGDIQWRLDRKYLNEGVIEENYLPRWQFRSMQTWDGALLDNGGVAWNRFLPDAGNAYGVNAGTLTFWSRNRNSCLRVTADTDIYFRTATFTHAKDGTYTIAQSATKESVPTRSGLRRFLPDGGPVFAPIRVEPSSVSIRLTLKALKYDEEYDRGDLRGIPEESVNEILNTIGRYGVVDKNLYGSNGWRTGWTVLQEPWLALFGIAVNDTDFINGFTGALDYARDHAVMPDGRVLPRWHHDDTDAMPGTFRPDGFYECQWGYMLDAQPAFAIDVAEQFDLTGDTAWLREYKPVCEKVLGYMTSRDSDGDGLFEVIQKTHHEGKGTDWLDVVWASWEVSTINAFMYKALMRWSELEALLGDKAMSDKYLALARKLKSTFNKNISDGGFWDPDHQWYVHWREPDGSVYGNNFVTVVNFLAIGYGVCDNSSRIQSILTRTEELMQKENLFIWPACFLPYEENVGLLPVNYPWPNYENGDMFLAWAELGTRCYAGTDPGLALRYIRNVIRQYEKDGLGFQRYTRVNQTGAGDDILSNNIMAIVGLYRNIYGIRPQYNRLYLEPHLPVELDGTQIKYHLRGQDYLISLTGKAYSIRVSDVTFTDDEPFAVNRSGEWVEYFKAKDPKVSLRISGADLMDLDMTRWDKGSLEWSESGGRKPAKVRHEIHQMQPGSVYELMINDRLIRNIHADVAGILRFEYPVDQETLHIRLIQGKNSLRISFISPPDSARPRVYWWWLYNRVDKDGITRDLEEFRAKGISGVNLICTGGYAGKGAIPGVEFLGEEWRELFRHAIREAKRLNIEIGFNLAGGWTMMGPWVTKDHAMKKLVFAEKKVAGPRSFEGMLPKPEVVDSFYHDIRIQAFRLSGNSKIIDPKTLIDLTSGMTEDGHLTWQVPDGEWVILRSGYTLTGHPWSRWYAYPKGDTFEGGEGYEIDYLNTSSVDLQFDHLGKLVIEEAKKAGGELAYLWSDSWECGKLTWTQDFFNQFKRLRGYDLEPYLPAMAGYQVHDSLTSARLREDFDRTIQDCIAENFYGHFRELCRQKGMKVGNEAGGPNDIPPQDALKNLGRCDIPSGEFWVNYTGAGQYNPDRGLRLNLKQTATAAHVYGIPQVQAESFTQMQADRTHWSHGPSDLKPYANDAFCEGINRFMLHQATCQPPSDGKPGYEFCAGQHFTPNITWWEEAPAFFSYLSRCQFMLQQGKYAADVCFYLGERPPTLAPPEYIVPSLGPGYDCDYANAEVLLTRMSVEDGNIVLPDGMRYRLLVLQNCVSPSPEICRQVGGYQQLNISPEPSESMSPEVIRKIRELVLAGATVVGEPPKHASGLNNWPECDRQVQAIAAEIWGDLDGITRTERKFGKGRVIWGKTAREVLLADRILPDVTFEGQESNPEEFDYIHRTSGQAEIYFVINRTNKLQQRNFTFRVSGRQPEIWDPVTGEMHKAEAFRQHDGCTGLPLEFAPYGSWFIVFTDPLKTGASGNADRNSPVAKEIMQINGKWQVAFDPQWGGPAEAGFPELVSWTARPESGIRYYSGRATYRIHFDMGNDAFKKPVSGKSRPNLWLDLGDVRNVARIRLNGKDLGIFWCAPWRADITGAIQPGGNDLEIEVINLWANRVIGDLNLPKEQRFTTTHEIFRFDMLRPATPLLESGLLGPVRIFGSGN